MTRSQFLWLAIAAAVLSYTELIWAFRGPTDGWAAMLTWSVPPFVGLTFFLVGWPLAMRDRAHLSSRTWSPGWLDRFLGRATWPLGLGALAFGLAGVGVALGFLTDPDSSRRINAVASWLTMFGVMLGHAAILIGIVSQFIVHRTARHKTD